MTTVSSRESNSSFFEKMKRQFSELSHKIKAMLSGSHNQTEQSLQVVKTEPVNIGGVEISPLKQADVLASHKQLAARNIEINQLVSDFGLEILSYIDQLSKNTIVDQSELVILAKNANQLIAEFKQLRISTPSENFQSKQEVIDKIEALKKSYMSVINR